MTGGDWAKRLEGRLSKVEDDLNWRAKNIRAFDWRIDCIERELEELHKRVRELRGKGGGHDA